jgi:hypothetical protein
MPVNSDMSSTLSATVKAPVPLDTIRAGMLLRVPKLLHRSARHDSRKSAVGVWNEPGAQAVWLEVKSGGLLRVSKGARQVDGVAWRRVGSPDGSVDGYAREDTLRWLDLVVEMDHAKPVRDARPQQRPPNLLEWAYVGVSALQQDQTMGRCIKIEYDHLPDANYLGLGTFRMLDGRCRRAWLVHAQYVDREKEKND